MDQIAHAVWFELDPPIGGSFVMFVMTKGEGGGERGPPSVLTIEGFFLSFTYIFYYSVILF